MLSSSEIEAGKRRGLLFPIAPQIARRPQYRAFLLCRPLYDALAAGKADADAIVRHRWAQLEAAMIHFVENGRVTDAYIKQLDPKKLEHWELRSRRPKPSLRIFGRFALPDVFVGTHVKERKKLGGKWSFEFELEKLLCEQYYKEAGLTYFHSCPPSFELKSYVTENSSSSVEVPK